MARGLFAEGRELPITGTDPFLLPSGRVREFRVYVSPTPFKGL